MCAEKPFQSDLEKYDEIIKRLHLYVSVSERKKLMRSLVGLLRSDSVSVRRSAKYKLRELLGYKYKALKQWSLWGPPEEKEILWWERKFGK